MPESAEAIAEDLEHFLEHDRIAALVKALKEAAYIFNAEDARFLVDAYYQVQEGRKAAANQVRSATGTNLVVEWLCANLAGLEAKIKTLLAYYADGSPVGVWSQSIVGIGPVIAAGLLAQIDMSRAQTVGHIWRFAGLDPTSTWGKGEKRPWNAKLKVLCWKIGQSFVKVSNHEEDIYGHLYQERKAYEVAKNEAGDYADQAAATLEKVPAHKQRAIYKTGKLPPGRIDQRAQRWATKLFLAHWHHVAYETQYGTPPPKPYVIERAGHVNLIGPPNWPMAEAVKKSRAA